MTIHPPPLTNALATWLEGGGRRIGELVILRCGTGWELRHGDDAAAAADALAGHDEPAAAREIAKYDAAGAYRPLKAAPSLIRGWRLALPDVEALREALDFFYPAALGNWVAFTSGRAAPSPLKETFARQTGMYRITGLLDEDDCRTVVAANCDYASNCRRRIAWPIAAGVPLDSVAPEKTDLTPADDEMPILCLHACSLLVAAARTHIKKKRAAGP
jgi:sirohydrochlorin cobaltochelatase